MKRIYSIRLLTCIGCVLLGTYASGQNNNGYFQQEVRYSIDVKLDDTLHMLHGQWELTYINNSPQSLSEIRMHIWPNAYSSNSTALSKQLLNDGSTQMYYLNNNIPGSIDSLSFSTAGIPLKTITHPEHSDICTLVLNQPLKSGDSIHISTPFRVKIPSGTISRLGHIEQAYAITQWYPKPAVYDQHGWHEMPYLNQGEFYSEYGSYDVRITLPANYVVGATGDLQSPEEQAFLDKLAEVPIDIRRDMQFPPSENRMKTIRFTQSRVHDFAWFADKRFQVKKGEVTLPYSGRKVSTWAMFTPKEARLWDRAIEYINDAVYSYSKWVGEYPYNQCTAVDGTISAGGGMEYPNVTIIGSSGSAFPLEVVIAHEVGHNWFYGLLGSNEREHPWMDEGINSYYEMRYVLEKYPPSKFGNINEFGAGTSAIGSLLGLNKLDYRQSSRFSYLVSGAAYTEQAIGLPADQFTGMNYGSVVYKKTAVAMDYLASYLGQEMFDSCMHTYFNQWVFKHPSPQHIRQVFESVSGKNLGWFFEGLIHAEEGSDACLRNVQFNSDHIRFNIIEKGPVPMPVEVTAYRGDSAVATTWVEPWKTGHQITCSGCDRLVIDAERRSLDVNPNNNSTRWSAPHLSWVPGIRGPKRNTIAITPVGGWNATDHWMTGLNITNIGVPNQPVEFNAMPLYSIGTQKLRGSASLEGIIPIKGRYTDRIRWRTEYRSFAFAEEAYRTGEGALTTAVLDYDRLSPQLTFLFRKATPNDTRRSELQLSSVHLWQDEISRNLISSNIYAGKPITRYRDFYRLAYRFQDNRTIDPWWTEIRAEANRQLLKAEGEFNYRYSYRKKKRGFDFRLYGGYAFIDKTDGEYGFFLSDRNGSRGSVDYAFDDWYFGRNANSGTLFSQMALRQGQFRQYTPFGSFKQWIVTVNMSSNLPGPFGFLKAFLDIGTTADLQRDIRTAYELEQSVSYTAGLQINLIDKAVAVYLPMLFSEELKQYEDFLYENRSDISSFDRFTRRIRFTFDLNKLRLSNLRNGLL